MSLFDGFILTKDYSGFKRDKDPIPEDNLVRYEAHDTRLILYRIPILRRTHSGCWVGLYEDEKKFVLNGSGKRWAYKTEQEAFESLLKRKRWHLIHVTRTFDRATKHLELIEQLKDQD